MGNWVLSLKAKLVPKRMVLLSTILIKIDKCPLRDIIFRASNVTNTPQTSSHTSPYTTQVFCLTAIYYGISVKCFYVHCTTVNHGRRSSDYVYFPVAGIHGCVCLFTNIEDFLLSINK